MVQNFLGLGSWTAALHSQFIGASHCCSPSRIANNRNRTRNADLRAVLLLIWGDAKTPSPGLGAGDKRAWPGIKRQKGLAGGTGIALLVLISARTGDVHVQNAEL